MKDIIKSELESHIDSVKLLHNLTDEIFILAQMCIDTLKCGGKILLFGNGGSAADAQHIAAELVGRFRYKRKGLPAIALTTDTSIITSVGNDFGFNYIFERQVKALADENDLVIGISTSGNSVNVINGLNMASKINCNTAALTGENGGKIELICNSILSVPSNDTARIQEMHILAGHIICFLVDKEFNS